MKRRLALFVSVLALLAGGTAVAFAASGGSAHKKANGPHGVVGVAASYLDISSSELRHDLQAGKTLGQVANATPGHSEAGLVAAILAARTNRLKDLSEQLPERVAALVKQARGRAHRHPSLARRAVLSYLGLDAKTLRSELQSGRTLAQLAAATPGKSSAGLESVILGARHTRIARAVGSGAITSHAATARSAKLARRVHAMVTRRHRAGHRSGHRAPAH